MRWPILADSLGDFWGRRWNAGFRDLAFGLLFARLAAILPARAAALAVFLASGLIHEMVITLPARSGYGWPTIYFLIQGAGLLTERSRFGRRLGLRHGIAGRCFALAVVVIPIGVLFPPPFVLGVMVPFFPRSGGAAMSLLFAIQLAGTLHLLVAAANLGLPRVLRYREGLADAPVIVRQIFYVHAFYIVLVLAGFGAACLFLPGLALHHALREILSGFLALFWSLRVRDPVRATTTARPKAQYRSDTSPSPS